MVDSDIIDWLQEHQTQLVEHIPDATNMQKFTMFFIDNDGHEHHISGSNLRECVRSAYQSP